MKWQRSGMKLTIVDTMHTDYSNPGYVLNESLMDPVQVWCWDTIPTATRMSFDTFKFEREEDITAFLLKWS